MAEMRWRPNKSLERTQACHVSRQYEPAGPPASLSSGVGIARVP
jgi:hypothetical protein